MLPALAGSSPDDVGALAGTLPYPRQHHRPLWVHGELCPQAVGRRSLASPWPRQIPRTPRSRASAPPNHRVRVGWLTPASLQKRDALFPAAAKNSRSSPRSLPVYRLAFRSLPKQGCINLGRLERGVDFVPLTLQLLQEAFIPGLPQPDAIRGRIFAAAHGALDMMFSLLVTKSLIQLRTYRTYQIKYQQTYQLTRLAIENRLSKVSIAPH